MKTLFFTALLGAACVSAYPQGLINFSNGGPGYNAVIDDVDGTTRLAGTNYSVDLYWAPGIVTDECALQPLQAPAFFSSTAPGWFFGGPRTIPAPPGSTITAQLRVWPTAAGSSFLDAECVTKGGHIGVSILFQVILPAPPGVANLMGLNGHPFSLAPYILDPEVSIQVVTSADQIVFNIAANFVPTVVIESTTNLSNPDWSPVQTMCVTCPISFSIPVATNSPARFYRVGWQPLF